MELKSFLQWEVPQKAYGDTAVQEPACYITRQYKQGDKTPASNYRLIWNQAFIKEALPHMIGKEPKREVKCLMLIHFDRKTKVITAVFDTPKDIPAYLLRKAYDASYAMQITNKMLLEEMWSVFKIPQLVKRQEFDIKKGEVVDGLQTWVMTYNPRTANNTQWIAAMPAPKAVKKPATKPATTTS